MTVVESSVPEHRHSGTWFASWKTSNPTYGCRAPSGCPYWTAATGAAAMARANAAAATNEANLLRIDVLPLKRSIDAESRRNRTVWRAVVTDGRRSGHHR